MDIILWHEDIIIMILQCYETNEIIVKGVGTGFSILRNSIQFENYILVTTLMIIVFH